MHYNVYTMHKERDDNMTKKKEEVARLAEQFMSIKSEEGKAMAIIAISAYVEGRAAGKRENQQEQMDKAAIAV